MIAAAFTFSAVIRFVDPAVYTPLRMETYEKTWA